MNAPTVPTANPAGHAGSPPSPPSPPARRNRLHLPSLARIQRLMDTPTRWTLAGLGAWVLWRTREAGPLMPWWPWIIGVYALTVALTSAFWLVRGDDARTAGRRRADALVAYLSCAADALFATALIWRDGGLGSPLYILLVLLALKAIGAARVLPGMVWTPFAFGPLYVLALWLASGNLSFLADAAFQSRYVLLLAWLVGMVFIAWELAQRSAQARALDETLAQQQAALAQKTETLQRTATDLGDRVLELRGLQEVAKALATTLRTEETLALVAENLRSLTGSSHCSVGLLDVGGHAGAQEGGSLHGVVVSDDLAARTFEVPLVGEPAVVEASRLGRSLRVAPAAPASGAAQGLAALLGCRPYSVIPLVSRGQPLGALCITEDAGILRGDQPERKPDVSEQLITSFAYFAATAIENARLYQDAWEKRRELEAVLAGIGDGVVVVDPDLSLILMNPVARDILGLEAEPPADVPLHPDLAAPAFTDLLADTLRSGQELIRELELGPAASAHAAGQAATAAAGASRRDEAVPRADARTYGALASPVLDADGDVNGVVVVLRDITAQKELERMKSNFLSVVSHELRTPLHSIKGFVEIILMGKTGPVTALQEDFLRTVRTQTTVLQRMIDDLLEFSRMEAGRVKLQLAEVSLPAMADAVVTKLRPLAEEAGLHLRVDLPADLPEIDGDRVRLEQVLTNLVENAIKFTPAGGEITVGGLLAGDRVRLTVSDTGIGIPPSEQEKVFDRFYQVDGSERRAYRGTGLGLSISRHIVERHCGRIWAESEGIAGRGSRFHVELPVVLRPDEAPTIDFTTPARLP